MMNESILTDLAQTLATDEEAGFQQFRKLFFKALERRRLAECRALLEVLCVTTSPRLQRDCHYHEAILFFEHRQFDRAEALLRELLSDDALSPIQQARALLELALQFDEQGQWSEAEQFYLEALAAYQSLDDKWGQARVYNNLGISITFQVEQGDRPSKHLKKAIAYHQASLELARSVEDDWEIARNWHGLGMAYGLLADYPSALAAFQEHVAICQTRDDPCDQAISLSDLAALVYQPQGQWAEATAALDEAITILRGCDDDLHLAETLARQGNLLAEQDQTKAALVSYDEALVLVESIRGRLTAPTTQADYRATTESLYTAPLSLHLQQNDATRAFTAIERARSRILADLLAGQDAQPHADIPSHLLKQRDSLRQALDRAYAEEEPPADVPQLEQELASLDRQIELLDPTYAGLETVAPLIVEEVCDRLPSNSALLAYAGDANDRLWTLVVTAAGARAELVENVSARWLRDYLADHLDGTRRGSLTPDETTGHLSPLHLFPSLYQALIAPVLDTLQTAQTVYIVPFGPLHYLPLGALIPDLEAPSPLLAAGRRVVYAPSATILLNYCHTRPPSPHQDFLAVAPNDESLRFTLGAAETIARRVNGSTLTGSAATRQTFLAEAGRYRIVCFLGHAIFDQRYPMSSRLKLADGSLRANEILRELRLQADLVILSACETGRSQVLRGDEILGLSRAMLYAGTPSLLVTLWPVHEIPTRLLLEKFVAYLSLTGAAEASSSSRLASGSGFDPALALAAAQRWLRDLSCVEAQTLLLNWGELSATEIEFHLTALWHMTHPGESPQAESRLFAHPFFWSPYILIGDQLLSIG